MIIGINSFSLDTCTVKDAINLKCESVITVQDYLVSTLQEKISIAIEYVDEPTQSSSIKLAIGTNIDSSITTELIVELLHGIVTKLEQIYNLEKQFNNYTKLFLHPDVTCSVVQVKDNSKLVAIVSYYLV